MTSELYNERTDALIESPLNRTFDELLHMSETKFRTWAESLRDEVARIWQEQGAPPIFGFTTDEIVDQFAALSLKDVSDVLITDELIGRTDCLLPDGTLGSACRAFFPNIAKTKDLGSGGYNLWEYFSQPRLLDVFLKKMRRHFKRDGFYVFSRPITGWSFWTEIFRREPLVKIGASEPIPENYYALSGQPTAIMTISKPDGLYTISRPVLGASSGRECIELSRKWVDEGVDYGWDFWLEAEGDSEASESRASAETPFTVSKHELEELRKKGVIPQRYLKNIEFVAKDPKTKRERTLSFDEAEPSQPFLIRGYYKDQMIFPKGFRAFQAGVVLGATNFPPSVAKYLYRRFTDDIKDQDQINIYDSSAGFGGRLLGALSAGTDRQLHYVGTDPNPDNWLEEAGMSRYEALARFYHRNVCQAHQTTYEFFQLGSEVIRDDRRFKKYRGKLDLVFTSPPYFDAEGYSDDENQSFIKFPIYDEWRDGFLRPTFETAFEWLRPGRPLIWNMADTKEGQRYYPLENDSRAILQELGMQYETKLKLVLAHSPGANRLDRQGFPETKNFCMIGGTYRKYEPIFVFRKAG